MGLMDTSPPKDEVKILPPKQTFMSLSWDYFKFFLTCASIYGVGYFRLSASWVLLGSLGYFILEHAKSKTSKLTSSLKAIGEDEKAFIIQNFTVRDLPSWVYFPDVERAEWLNKVIKRMWPSISEYARDIIVTSIEPVVAQNLPTALTPFSFATIDLGDTPPRIGGVKVYMSESIRKDEIVMDLDLMLYSDARIKVNLGKIRAGVKEFELRGTLRVVMKPLVPKVPFAGAVTVCFLDSPYINFSLTDMGNILGLPGLQQTLNTVIRNVVNQMVVLPNRLPVQLVPDIDIQRLKYPLPQGVLHINVISGRNLKAGDKNVIGHNTSDPYCVVRVGARSFTTSVVKETLEPVWNQHFESIVDICHGQSVTVEVYDKDQGNKDDYLGCTSIPIESVLNKGEVDTWSSLEGVKTGSLHLQLTWFRLSYHETDFLQSMEKALQYRKASGRSMSSGFLYVVIEQAHNLPSVKQLQEPSPFCNIHLGRDYQTNEVKEKTQNPVWNSVHHFLVSDPNVDILQLIIRDSRTEMKLGSCSIHLKTLLTQKNMSVTQPFTLQDTGRETSTVYMHLQLLALLPGQHQNANSCGNTDIKTTLSRGQELTDTSLSMEKPTDESTTPDPETVVRNRFSEDKEMISSTESLSTDFDSKSVQPVKGMMTSNSVQQISNSSLGRIRLTIQYHSASNLLEVIVHECQHLSGVDKDGLSDPYVKLYLMDLHENVVSDSKKTKTVKDNLNPTYEENFQFPIEADHLPLTFLRLDVKNHVGRFTRSGKTHFIGTLSVNLIDSIDGNAETKWYDLASPIFRP
uniref:Protein FAM62B n=1 Tax=Schistosoma japonicum TaxID=6182 RepID=C1LIB8_SCHJA|nr:Protein FAM62B [Schistosoma japonicum]